MIAQARIGQLSASRDDSELLSVAVTMDRLAADLRDSTLSILCGQTEGQSGATIQGDGMVAPIVDVSALIRATNVVLQVAG